MKDRDFAKRINKKAVEMLEDGEIRADLVYSMVLKEIGFNET